MRAREPTLRQEQEREQRLPDPDPCGEDPVQGTGGRHAHLRHRERARQVEHRQGEDIERHVVAKDGIGLTERLAVALSQATLRRAAEPADTAAAVVYLASDSASFVTGQTLRPHGGDTMPW